MRGEVLTLILNVLILISGVCWASAVISLFSFFPLEIVSSGFLVAVATTVAAIAVALFAIREQEKGHPYFTASI
jgi:hypothetical protein